MNRNRMKQLVFMSLISALSLSGCAEKDVYQGERKNKPINPSEVFDFNLMKQVNVNVDFGFTDYYIIFQLYDQNPLKEVDHSWIKDEALAPLYSASTDKAGKFSGTIPMPSSVTEVWLYTDYLGAVVPVKLAVSANSEINFNQKEYIASLKTKTRATASNGYTYLDDWMLMPGMTWDVQGLPSNIEDTRSMPPSATLYSIKETYNKIDGKKIPELHPEWFNNNATSEIKITKDTELSLVFINSGADFNNVVGYFTYPTGTIPTEATIQKVMAFPNALPINKPNGKGALLCGHEVKLKYWNGSKFEEKFPAGVTVGWCLQANAFKNGNITKGLGTRYSYSSMNKSDDKQRVVALRDSDSDQIVAIGFEDSTGNDYCDAVFYLKVKESGAISPEGPELPPVDPPGNEENTITLKGTLAFEDLWPSVGDYDMNDVVIEYQSTIYKNILVNTVYKIVDEFSVVHNGASYTCGFGYQLHKLSPDRVRKISVEGPAGWRVEEGQAYSTVVLFDDHKSVMKQKFIVTTELADVDFKLVNPPYNPFIFVNDRSKEVHLVNYPPTNKANMDLFNTKNDVSNTSSGVYYIAPFEGSVDLMPYCIHLPIHNFKLPDEKVKIYDVYPGFVDWVKSGRPEASDWYKK